MTFFTRVSRPVVIAQDVSHTCVVLEDTEIIQDGRVVIVPKGEVNLYEKVQADKAACNIYNILNRFARGDVDVIAQRVGQFVDISEMPTSIVDAHKKLDTMAKAFASMPVDFKEKFGNSFETFLEKGANMTPDDFSAFVNPVNKEVENNVEE